MNPGENLSGKTLIIVIHTRSAAFLARICSHLRGGKEPFEQLWSTSVKRIVETLVRSRGETAQGSRQGADLDFGHKLNLRASDADDQTRLHLAARFGANCWQPEVMRLELRDQYREAGISPAQNYPQFHVNSEKAALPNDLKEHVRYVLRYVESNLLQIINDLNGRPPLLSR